MEVCQLQSEGLEWAPTIPAVCILRGPQALNMLYSIQASLWHNNNLTINVTDIFDVRDKQLSSIAQSEPQSGFAAFMHGIVNEWLFS